MILDLIRAIRNARSEAHLEQAAWLATEVAVPSALGTAFEALRPAVERLAHARPLDRRLTRDALADDPDTLTAIAGDLEARIQVAATADDGEAAALERTRLERELADQVERLRDRLLR
ncbi:MAG: hypothetical protein WEG56_04905 [Chloroflexota bacterium]